MIECYIVSSSPVVITQHDQTSSHQVSQRGATEDATARGGFFIWFSKGV